MLVEANFWFCCEALDFDFELLVLLSNFWFSSQTVSFALRLLDSEWFRVTAARHTDGGRSKLLAVLRNFRFCPLTFLLLLNSWFSVSNSRYPLRCTHRCKCIYHEVSTAYTPFTRVLRSRPYARLPRSLQGQVSQHPPPLELRGNGLMVLVSNVLVCFQTSGFHLTHLVLI